MEQFAAVSLRRVACLRALVPGVLLAGVAAGVALAVHALVPTAPVVLVALALGLLISNGASTPARAQPGLRFSSGALLKAGIVLLGLELVVQDMVSLGARTIALVVVVVLATFLGTRWFGQKLGLSAGLSMLVATGFSICGVSAVAAARGVSDADEEEVTYAIALVTLCGSLAIVLLPALRRPLGLDEHAFGIWVGASVHDVAQVVATSSAVGGAAVTSAIVVKLTRVLLLAPLVAGIGWRKDRHDRAASVVLVPPFVIAFVGAALVRSAGLLPQGLLTALSDVKTALLALALFAVGARVDLRQLLAVGGRPLILGLSSWATVAVVAYLGVRVVST